MNRYKTSHEKSSLMPILMLLAVMLFFSCADAEKTAGQKVPESVKSAPAEKKQSEPAVRAIGTIGQLKKIIDSSPGHLLIFDLYADWCMPCRILSPMLEEIARENAGRASVYKINVDRNPDIAGALGARGIPYVIFVKNQEAVEALTGVYPKEVYQRTINRFAENVPPDTAVDTPNGRIIDGIRVITLTTAMELGKIYIYRGETVKLTIKEVPFEYSIHIPQYNISKAGVIGKDLEVTFKAEDIGVFPIFCNGNCPSGDGSQFGRIVVMQFKTRGDSEFLELTAAQATRLIAESNPLILDVRTPKEYYTGHIEGARLIPLDQLARRISEIEAYKEKDILIYCRSGNRSTVAAQILIDNGFKKLHNLRPGFIGWQKAEEKPATQKK